MIIEQINTIKKIKGIKNAEDESWEWFRKARKNPLDISVSFCQNQMLQVGKINSFSYYPKGKDTLDYYDKKPLVLSLGIIQRKNRKYELGINLNFIPTPYKEYILEYIQKTYSGFFQRQKDSKIPSNAYAQPQILYKYAVIKSLLEQYGVGFAIRTYIPSRKKNVFCINYNNWINASFLSIEKFEGITYAEMITEFKKYKNSK